jgi:hypothetical protein
MSISKRILKDHESILLLREIQDSIKNEDALSTILHKSLLLCKKRDDSDLEKWIGLELNGYIIHNQYFKKDEVPTYRSVSGKWQDDYQRPLQITDPKLLFINQVRLIQGVIELERLAYSNDFLTMSDLNLINLIKENLKVHVTTFVFNPTEINRVLALIQTELINRLSIYQIDKNFEAAGGKKSQKKNSLRTTVIGGVIVAIITIFILTPLSDFVFKRDRTNPDSTIKNKENDSAIIKLDLKSASERLDTNIIERIIPFNTTLSLFNGKLFITCPGLYQYSNDKIDLIISGDSIPLTKYYNKEVGDVITIDHFTIRVLELVKNVSIYEPKLYIKREILK